MSLPAVAAQRAVVHLQVVQVQQTVAAAAVVLLPGRVLLQEAKVWHLLRVRHPLLLWLWLAACCCCCSLLLLLAVHVPQGPSRGCRCTGRHLQAAAWMVPLLLLLVLLVPWVTPLTRGKAGP